VRPPRPPLDIVELPSALQVSWDETDNEDILLSCRASATAAEQKG